MDHIRHNADPELKYKLYLNQLYDQPRQYNIEPRNSYSMDEKSFMIGVFASMKRVFDKSGQYNGGIKTFIHDNNREWITILPLSALMDQLFHRLSSGILR